MLLMNMELTPWKPFILEVFRDPVPLKGSQLMFGSGSVLESNLYVELVGAPVSPLRPTTPRGKPGEAVFGDPL